MKNNVIVLYLYDIHRCI